MIQIKPPKKIRYPLVLSDLAVLIQHHADDYYKLDYKYLQTQLAQYYHAVPAELELHGFERAYRQLIEGI